MARLVNETKFAVQFYAAGCVPESGTIGAQGSVEVQSTGPAIVEVVLGAYGNGEAPVRAMNVPENATVTLSLTVR